MNIIQKLLNTTRNGICSFSFKHVLHKINLGEIVLPIRQYSSYFNKKTYTVLNNKINNFTYSYIHSDSIDSTENHIDGIEDIAALYQYDEMLQYQPVRNLLYFHIQDQYFDKLNNCKSVQDVFNFIRTNGTNLQHEHIAQTVLVLWDLRNIFCYQYQIDSRLKSHIDIDDYIMQLKTHPDFLKLLDFIKIHYLNFTTEATSCVLLYLNKLGLSINHEVLQLLVTELQKSLTTNISLTALSRFIVAVFSEQNLGSYFLLQGAIPVIEQQLDRCTTAEELKLITISLHHLNHIVSNSFIEKYVRRVQECLDNDVLNSKEDRTLLKIIMFLSLPRSCNKYNILISKLMMLLKDHLHLLSISNFLIAYEVLYKTHEPGELLTEIQRCASRLLLHFEEESYLSAEIRLKLLSASICFSSPLQRPEYEKMISNYIKVPLTKSSIFDLLRILTFVKPSDAKICEDFWDNTLKVLEEQELYKDNNILLKLTQKYINYCNDLHYRHNKFESKMIHWLSEELKNGTIGLFPSQTALASAFIFAYGKDPDLIDYTSKKISENWEQLKHADCLYISKSFRGVTNVNSYVTTSHISIIQSALEKAIDTKLLYTRDNLKINFLLKSCIYSQQANRELIDKLILTLNPHQMISSNWIRHVIFNLQTTNSLMPEIINNIADYTIEYRNNLMGFNAERIIYLCYYLGYMPPKLDELCQVVSDIIIRDQERISGLSYILTALSLCFFNKLPNSFIKNVFNVAFLEKLDSELSTCYFKDIYPVRVRHNMMQLNRAVCLDYPQANIPWFHKKYIEEFPKKGTMQKSVRKDNTLTNIELYLSKISSDHNCILQEINTPYGYHINFVIHLDSNGNIIKPTNDENEIRVAILLMKPSAYTHINVQLKGQYQLKQRHLEILGYRVVLLDLDKWNSLVYGEEKMQYLTKIIWPDGRNVKSYFARER